MTSSAHLLRHGEEAASAAVSNHARRYFGWVQVEAYFVPSQPLGAS
jgi:hypothetical protein